MITTNIESRECCENCGCDQLQTFVISEQHDLLFCPECLLYQKGTPPENEHYESFYHTGYARRRNNKIITARVRLGALTKYVNVEKPRMLDIGCSIGATVEAGTLLGWRASGVDVSSAAVNFCSSLGLDCHKIDGTELPFADDTFDVVTSWHVIEHVSDVKETLAEWNRVLKPGGIMVLETPDSQCLKARTQGARYAKFWPQGHLYTFTRSNMSSLLEQSGFEVLPSRIIGSLTALPPHMTMYAAAYRTLRKAYRGLGLCKSIEVCSRKISTPAEATKPQRAAA
ncbi:MAG: methyltransferase domain-containing protein [Planctomycetota bacterium]